MTEGWQKEWDAALARPTPLLRRFPDGEGRYAEAELRWYREYYPISREMRHQEAIWYDKYLERCALIDEIMDKVNTYFSEG